MKNSKTLLFVSIIILLLCQSAAAVAENDLVVDTKRNKLIGYMLGKQLPSIHYSDKLVDDDLSRAAFDLYIKQLDFQKRFLLASDVAELSSFATEIDDNLLRGTIGLPEVGYQIMVKRIGQVKQLVDEILAERLDTGVAETMETDPEKLGYAVDEAELRQRWRKILKAQIMNRYLDLEEEYSTSGETINTDEIWREATERVSKRFTDFFNRLDQETLQDHYDRYFNAVARAFDPHTNYMPPDRKEDFDIHMRGSLEGIGALLREEYGYIKVVRIIPGSASAKEGRLQAEDIIMAVAEKGEEPVEVTDMRLRDAVRLIRGPKGTDVELTVRKPDGTDAIITITRDVVQIEETFVKHATLEVDGVSFGYINIPSFYRDFEKSRFGQGRNSTEDTRAAITELKSQGIAGLILDLRNNGGGSLVDAVDITGLFIDDGPVVQV
ncbi:MAG: S41 family peptidase, partial [Desulfofustis sp.]